jgi:hypothetical protein
MSSVAFWYQVEPHQPWPALPPGAQRLPFQEAILLKGHSAVAAAKHSEGPLEEQPIGGTTDGKQLWFHPSENNAWVELSFDCPTNLNAVLTARTVHSHDYGIYRVLLDGKSLAQLDLYGPEISTAAEKLGTHQLTAGSHTLRFECVGKSSKSAGYFLGFDALGARIPVYSRPASVDLKTLQKRP